MKTQNLSEESLETLHMLYVNKHATREAKLARISGTLTDDTIWDVIGKDAWEWDVKYSALGWTIEKHGAELSVLISEQRAMRFVRHIEKSRNNFKLGELLP